MFARHVLVKPLGAVILAAGCIVPQGSVLRTAVAQKRTPPAENQKGIGDAAARDIGLVTLKRLPPAVTRAFKLVEGLKFPVLDRKSLITQIITKKNADASPLAIGFVLAAYRSDDYPIKNQRAAVTHLHTDVLRAVGLDRIPNPENDRPIDRPDVNEPREFPCRFDDSPCGRAAESLVTDGFTLGGGGGLRCGRLRLLVTECERVMPDYAGYSAECRIIAQNVFADENIGFFSDQPPAESVEDIISNLLEPLRTSEQRREEALLAAAVAGEIAATWCEALQPGGSPDPAPGGFPPPP